MARRRVPVEDSVGRRFGKLVVDSVFRTPGSRRASANAVCDCGGEWSGRLTALRSNHTTSCGCVLAGATRERSVTHGMSRTPEYRAWLNIKRRCLDPNHMNYRYYGGRGITLHKAWISDFEAFYCDIGPRPSVKHTVDRNNNDLGYVPGNVSWQTRGVQANNTRSNRLITISGERMTMAQWCRTRNMPYHTVAARITKLGWDTQRALFVPVRGRPA